MVSFHQRQSVGMSLVHSTSTSSSSPPSASPELFTDSESPPLDHVPDSSLDLETPEISDTESYETETTTIARDPFDPSSPSPYKIELSPFAAQQLKESKWKKAVKDVVTLVKRSAGRGPKPPQIIDLLDETRPGRPLPNLPPELWITIIRYASQPPDPYSYASSNSSMCSHGSCTYSPVSPVSSYAASYSVAEERDCTHDAVSGFLLPPNHQERAGSHTHFKYKQLMRLKLSYALVSKVWNAYTQPVLYEHVWISRAAQAKALALTLLCQVCADPPSLRSNSSRPPSHSGIHIRRLHIETSILERCNPADIRTILDYSPRLVVYSDYRSVRRNLLEEEYDPRSAPEELLKVLARRGNALRRLSWTNYGDVGLQDHIMYLKTITPSVEHMLMNLEYLELNFCEARLGRMYPGSMGSTAPFASLVESTSIWATAQSSSSSSVAAQRGGAPLLHLPSLTTLKVVLDDPTFTILALWDMPSLKNVSVIASDFKYAGKGFESFFVKHGEGIKQLELGHSTSEVGEHYLTAVGGFTGTNALTFGANGMVPLATWCPNLKQFICSADAEWNWEQPDWIAPHVLLPCHPGVEFIGIRDLGKRVRGDWELRGQGTSRNDSNDDSAFFMLFEQICSLLQPEMFPSLKYIRDLSEESDLLRRGIVPLDPKDARRCSISHTPTSSRYRSSSTLGRHRSMSVQQESLSIRPMSSSYPHHSRLIRFWQRILERTKEREVWLEDWRGLNVTRGNLERWKVGDAETRSI